MNSYLSKTKDTIISEYGVRFFAKQKKKFREYVKEEMNNLGWDTEIIKKNIVIGDIEKAKYVYTAHYDTPGKIPAYARWVFKLFGNTSIVLAPLLILVILILYTALIGVMAYRLGLEKIAYVLVDIPYMFLLIGIFIPNKNNYTDNTSGVLTLLNIAHEISIQNLDKEEAAFIFFNNEEWGLLGSAEMKKYMKKNNISIENKKMVNFDCVGNGDEILITHGKNDKFAKEIGDRLKRATPYNVEKFRYKGIPLSDDFIFRKIGAIGIIFCKKSKFRGYYIPNIHCNKDIILDLSNINFLTNQMVGLLAYK